MNENVLNLSFPGSQKHVSGTVQLTGSKSESNRALVMQALSGGKITIGNLSRADDTLTLDGILKAWRSDIRHQTPEIGDEVLDVSNLRSQISNPESTLDVGPAGTAMRFLTAYAALQPGATVLTGSQRMKERPIGILVEALRTLGAEITYVENEGFPPLLISGPLQQQTTKLSIQGNISSQYISALLLIAPALPRGLELHIKGQLTSKPYVEMTLAMLNEAGIDHIWQGETIVIKNQLFQSAEIQIEPDWSAASYWYAIAALASEADLVLPGLKPCSLQGDSHITEIMANFGITTQFNDGAAQLKKESKMLQRKVFDFKECPDLAQTVIVCCAALGHNATFTGLETLKIKETDRIKALQTELVKIGVHLIEKNMTYKLDCSGLNRLARPYINTYHDHRMAMAFAPLALMLPEISIEYPAVVNKSYPAFWEHLAGVGFKTG